MSHFNKCLLLILAISTISLNTYSMSETAEGQAKDTPFIKRTVDSNWIRYTKETFLTRISVGYCQKSNIYEGIIYNKNKYVTTEILFGNAQELFKQLESEYNDPDAYKTILANSLSIWRAWLDKKHQDN